jgi:hypothetical protein
MKFITGIIAILFAIYGLFTRNFQFSQLMNFFMGLYILFIGLGEIKKGRKGFGYLCIAVCLFAIFVSLQGFILN